MSQMEQDDDIATINKNRQTREEVRRRNREIMERANAELRGGMNNLNSLSGGFGGKKDLSRLSLIRRARDGSQSFLCDYRFHTATPELKFAPLKVQLDVDVASFSELNLESSEQLFTDCLKATCMIDEVSVAYLDLINPDEAYPIGGSSIHPRDEALLSNEVAISSPAGFTGEDEGIYTGHFLRKPQLMSNDLFAEEGLARKTSSKFSMVGRDHRDRSLSPEAYDMINEEFNLVKTTIDTPFVSGKAITNPVSKKTMRVKRVLTLVPDQTIAEGDYMQFKFDESVAISKPMDLLMTADFGLFTASSIDDDNDFPKIFKKKRQMVLANRTSTNSSAEDFFLIHIPPRTDGIETCPVKPVGPKILLKKDIRVTQNGGGKEIQLSIAQ